MWRSFMSNNYKIYIHRNKINGKVYIGQTKQPLKSRWNNGYGYKQCTKFWNAIQKYGWDNFEHKLIEDNLTLDEANRKEQYYIQKYNSIDNGYNISIGGGSNYGSGKNIYQYDLNGNYIKEWFSISDIAEAFDVNDASSIYNCISNKINSCFGFQWSYVKKEKIPPVKSKSKIISELKRKPVYQYDRDGVFIKKYDYLEKVGLDGFNYKNVSECCIGNRTTCGDYQWSYEYYDNIGSVLTPHEITAKKQSKKVYQYSLDGIFLKSYDSLSSASKDTGINFKLISKCCLGSQKTCGGYQWSYDYFKELDSVKPYSRTIEHKKGIAINVFKKGILINSYPSIKDAEKNLNIKYYKIVDACKNGTIINELHFEYA